MDLIGTFLLPASIVFSLYLTFHALISGIPSNLSLYILLGTLFAPGILVILATKKLEYLGWLGLYFVSLPIWNFLLPLYAFWHFDDFSWGATRRLAQQVCEHYRAERRKESVAMSLYITERSEGMF